VKKAPPFWKGESVSDFVDRHLAWFMLGPAMLVLLALTIYPVLNLMAMAFADIRFEQAREIWTFRPLDNLRQLAGDEVFRRALLNTIVFAVAAVCLEMLIGLALAILVSSLSGLKGLVRTTLILPVLMPPVAIGSMWKLMYNLDFGVLNQAVTALGLQPINWLGSSSLALISVIIVDVWHWTPFVFLILFASVEGISKEIIDAARLDGAGNWGIVTRIIVPLIWPPLLVAALFRIIMAFKVFDQVFLLTSGGPGNATEVVSLHLYKVYFQENQLGYGSMLSLAIILALLCFIWISRRAGKAMEPR